MSKEYHTDYDEEATARCERVLLTLVGELGPWRERIYWVGGLAPRYLVGQLPEGAAAHVGTTDVDLVIGLALGDETPETYRTLQNNLEKAHFEQREPSYAWARRVDGMTVIVEFLCETDQVEAAASFAPRESPLDRNSARSMCGVPIWFATTSLSAKSRASGWMAAAGRE